MNWLELLCGLFIFTFGHLQVFLVSAAFHPSSILDHIVVKRVYHKFEAQDWLNCLTACLADERCSSYNFQLHSYKKSGLTCELSQCGMDDTREKSLIAKTGFVFHQVRHEKEKLLCRKTAQPNKPTSRPNQFDGLEMSSILNYPSEPKKYIDILKRLLDPFKSPWKRCYHDNSSSGLDAVAFHRSCDSKGPTITIVRVGKYIFGGFIDKSWGSSEKCLAINSQKAFLFSLYNVFGFKPTRINLLIDGERTAAWHCSEFGPAFGHGFDLILYSGSIQSFARPSSYATPSSKCSKANYCTFYTGTERFLPSEVEVFYKYVN